MADNKVNKRDFDKLIKDQIQAHQTIIDLQKKEFDGLSNIFSIEAKRQKALLDLTSAEIEQNARKEQYIKLQKQAAEGEISLGRTTLKNIEKELHKEEEYINKLKKRERVLRSINKINFKGIGDELLKLNAFNDKPIRETILQLGIGAEKGQLIRDSFYQALPKVAILGANMKDLASIQQGYTDESGRALALTGKQLEYITEIGRGTGLGVDNASKLVAQFELLGMSTENSQQIIQGIVDTTERMGINSTKVLKNISTNFKQLNTFAFKDGVKGMAKMASYAEKFKIDFDASINSADKARTLEGAIEMASQLQILGGEFTKADPFELFHLSRNDPAKYTQKLNEMVKGMSSLVKTADGFKLNTSPQDLDRLKLAAEATGIPFENLVEQSEKFAEIQAMNKQLMGTVFTKQDREAIQSMAKLDSKSGIYKVLGKDISKLSQQEIDALKIQQTTLKERAEASQTFDEKFQNTIEAMKYTLLPILDGINSIFDTIHPYLKGISEWMSKQPPWAKTLLKVIGGAAGISIALGMAGNVLKSIPFIGKIGNIIGGKGLGTPSGGGTATSGGGGNLAGGAGGGAKLLGAGAGIGLASAGIGLGINIAAKGIAKLADSMSKLDKNQVEALKTIAVTLAVSFPLAAIGIGILAAVAAPAAIPLLALGAAILGIGAGVGIAAAGIGYMAESFSTLLTSASPEKVFMLAAGVTALAGSMGLLAGGSIMALFSGGGAFALLALLSTRADAFERIGNSMKEIAVVLNSDGEGILKLKDTLDSIQNISTSGGLFKDLKDILSKPLKVEFKDKNVSLNVNMSVELDSTVLAKKTAKKIIVLHNDYQNGKAG